MPTRGAPSTVLVLGAGPNVLGHGGGLDFLCRQAMRALAEEGCRVVLLHPDPSTLSTDPALADRTYLEPLTPEVAEKVLERERVDGLLPIVGGQAALNLAFFLARAGVLARRGVRLLGVTAEAIQAAEDAAGLVRAMAEIGLPVPESGIARSVEEGMDAAPRIGFPLVLRPSFNVGQSACVYNRQELEAELVKALTLSPTREVQIQQSMAGWKAVAVELLRDRRGAVLPLATLENVDPMGVSTGDSLVVLPCQTLAREEAEDLVTLARRVAEKMQVVGAASVQLAYRRETGEVRVIDLTAHLARGSVLAAKLTGLPVAGLAARLALGRELAEVLPPDAEERARLFRETAGFVACRAPRFAWERFPTAERLLTASTKSVGESLGLGRTFPEAFQKALRSLDIRRMGAGFDGAEDPAPEALTEALIHPDDRRYFAVIRALDSGMAPERVEELTRIDPWFIDQFRRIVLRAHSLREHRGKDTLAGIDRELLLAAKRDGFSDAQIGFLTATDEDLVREVRRRRGIRPGLARAGGLLFPTYGAADARVPDDARSVLVVGGGPSRVGQGIERDTCCVQAAQTLRELGHAVAIVNSNPGAVSTDPDLADRIYLAPVSVEDVLDVIEAERPMGVILGLGGQSATRLAPALERAGVPLLGTPADAIDRAEDRERFAQLVRKLGLRRPEGGAAMDREGAREICRRIGYPVVARLSPPQGSRAMSLVFSDADLDAFCDYVQGAMGSSPILIDKFLDYATEADADALADGQDAFVAGIVEHIEEAGVHAGDSACVLPPHTLPATIVRELRAQTERIALELGVRGLVNVQFAIKGADVYVLGITPRASRSVPFVSKATGVPLAALAARVLLGQPLSALGLPAARILHHVAVKESVFPFTRFPGVDPVLGPQMRSTGEVMGIDRTYGMAFMKSQLAAGQMLPTSGKVFFSVKDADKRQAIPIARKFADMGFEILATQGTADVLSRNGIPHTQVPKIAEGRPHIVDRIINRDVHLLVNTPTGRAPAEDEITIRRKAYEYGVPLVTTLSGALASADAIEALRKGGLSVRSLQEFHEEIGRG